MAKGGRKVRIFSALEVANICGVVNQTAINWIRNGHLKAFTTPGGQYRIYAKDLAAFLDQRGMGASDEALQVITENASWNTFLIGAEESYNNNLRAVVENVLHDYTLVQGNDWFEIGCKITRERPGYILLDADLGGVDINKFINTVKEDPFYGKPYIFLVSGNSDLFLNQENNTNKRPDAVFVKPFELDKFEALMKTLERQFNSASA